MGNSRPTMISDIGEFGLIDRLTSKFSNKQGTTVTGVGDDAAVIDAGNDYIVITTDLLTEGIHFNLIYTPLKHLGYKAVAVNLSDVYAMNAVPRQITVSIAVSGKFSLEALEQLYSGIHSACEKFNVDLVGGDTSSSMTGMTISITAIGRVNKEDVVYRKGARVNDLICVSGDLGAAYLGLQLLEREKVLFEKDPSFQPDFTGMEYLLERQLKPEPCSEIITLLRENGIKPTSMIDISDGLSSEILHICKNSEVGCRLYQDKIPISAVASRVAGDFNMEPLICALHGGEDYELLFTVPLSDYQKLSQLKGIHIIGNITAKDEKAMMVTKDGGLVEIIAEGWDGIKQGNN